MDDTKHNSPTANITPPTELDVKEIVSHALGKEATAVFRYPTVISNFVYDVQTKDGDELIVKLARPDINHFFDGALFWYRRLEQLEIPIPKLYYYNNTGEHGFPILIMEKLPGEDLEAAYPHLTTDEKKTLARKIAKFSQKIATLPPGNGFGNARSYDDTSLYEKWIDYLNAHIEHSREKIKEAGLIDEQMVDIAKEKLLHHEEYFAKIKPTCFLANMTTRNVVVKNGHLSGITGVHNVSFGDPLFPIAMTRMTLLSYGYDTEYIEYWLEELNVTEEQKKAFDSYTLLFCVDRLSDLGHTLQKNTEKPANDTALEQLKSTFETLLATEK